MTFERAWVLVFLLLPVVWLLWEWRSAASRAGLLLKSLSWMAVLFALAEPVLLTWETKLAVAVLADTSASVSDSDLQRSSQLAGQIRDESGRHQVRLLPFAAEVRAPAADEISEPPRLHPTAGASGRATDIETALLEAIAGMPAGLVPRVVLISDGLENRGSVSRAAWQARELGVPVDTFALEGRPQPRLAIEAIRFPALTFAGERFPIELSVRSPRDVEGIVRLNAEGRPIGTSPVTLKEGLNHVTVFASLNLAGAFDVAGSLEAGDLGAVRFAQAVTVSSPRVLFVSMDPEGTETHLLGALRSGSFEVSPVDSIPENGLERFEAIVLNNWDMEAVAEDRKSALESFVQQGGALLVIGGERNVYVEDRLKIEDPLERALPAKLVPPKSPEGTCLVLIIDKSSSMEGRKMELARLSAIGVIENLRPQDRVGVLIFDNSFQWAVPIRKAENRTLIKRLISGITPDGGTQIAPALAEAYRRILPQEATYKHIVLLTDGISEEGDSIALAHEAAARRVTISTVGLGQDVNKSYLEKVALFAQGNSYFLTDPSGLAQILLRDVMEHTGQTTVEKPVVPIVAKETEVLTGLPEGEFPPLKGYVRYEAKRGAETVLRFDPEDPLLVAWQYGLGQTAVFTSDAKSRWAEAWVDWPGFDTFWLNLLRSLLPHSSADHASVTFDRANRKLVVDYRLRETLADRPAVPELFVVGPEGFRTPLAVEKVADQAYRGAVDIGDRKGLFRVRALQDSADFPETGVYIEDPELNEYGANPDVLRALSEFTGGRFSPAVSEMFDTGGRAAPLRMPLWPGLLALAILLGFAELTVRKWSAIRA